MASRAWSDVAAGGRRLALLLSYQHRTSLGHYSGVGSATSAQFAIEVAATDRRRAARGVADAQLAVERAAADADEARANAAADADEARAKAEDEGAAAPLIRLRRSHDVATRARARRDARPARDDGVRGAGRRGLDTGDRATQRPPLPEQAR